MSKLVAEASPTVREIYRRMKEAGLTPASLATAVGAGPTYFNDLFAGRSKRPQVYIEEIAKVFQCSVEDLTNPRVSERPPSVRRETEEMEEAALLAFWKLLSRQGRRRVMEAVIAEARKIAAERPAPED
jgi:transcriptional regulator with XRE-family HTH domain